MTNPARLTPTGMTKLKSAWRVHLNSVRRRFFDHIDVRLKPYPIRLVNWFMSK
jgi:hypothetical protein